MKLRSYYNRTWPLLLILTFLSGCVLPWPHKTWRSVESKGRVLDERTHAPIEGAVIFNTGHPDFYCLSGADGRFWLKATYNQHFGYTMTPPESHDYPQGEVWMDGITITHSNYVTRQVGGDPFDSGPFCDAFLLRKNGEPTAPHPAVIFNGDGDILQDMGALPYLKEGGIQIIERYTDAIDKRPAKLRLEFVRAIYDPRLTAISNSQGALIQVWSRNGTNWVFRISYGFWSPKVNEVKDGARTYRLEFTP
jgi:hypothetical protein